MHHLSRRGVALLATAATLGAGSLGAATQAFGASSGSSSVSSNRSIIDLAVQVVLSLLGPNPTAAQVQTQLSSNALSSSQLGNLLAHASSGQLDGLLGGGLDTAQLTGAVSNLATTNELTGLLGTLSPTQTGDLLAPLSGAPLSTVLGALSAVQLNSALATLTPSELTTLFGGMTTPEVGGILGGANPTQLVSLLGALNPNQLGGALGLLNASQLRTVVTALNPTELSGLLGVLSPTQLTSVVGLLDPAQITGVLGSPGAAAGLVTGLLGTATSLGTAPSLGSVNALVGQLQALLGSGLPAVPGIDGLLTTVQPLLGVAGLDPSMLIGLLSTATNAFRTAGMGIDTSALLGLIGTLYGVLLPGAGTSPQPGTSTPPAQGAKPLAGQVGFTAYRARLGGIKLAANRRSAKVTVSCPSAAPKGCLVGLNGVVAGKKAFAAKTIVVMRNVTRTFTVNLTSAATSRLNKKGGVLNVSALTALSSLSSVTKSVKLAPRH
jgi:hypothetical protein